MDLTRDLYIRQSFPEIIYAAVIDASFWLLLTLTLPLLVFCLDGILSYEDIRFSLLLMIPSLSLAGIYVLVAGVTNNFNRLMQLHFSEQTLEIRHGQFANHIQLKRISHFHIDGLLLPALYLHLNCTARPVKISLYRLKRSKRRDILRRLENIANAHDDSTDVLSAAGLS